MHKLQVEILEVLERKGSISKKLRDVGALVGEPHPQKIKNHLQQLIKRGLIRIDEESGTIEKVKSGYNERLDLISIPILGRANCGEARAIAEENFEGFLKVSTRIIEAKMHSSLYILRAVGSSMNRADIKGEAIEDGDFIVIEKTEQKPADNEYIVSAIDGMCNIKKIVHDRQNRRVILISESHQELPPIYVTEEDDYFVNGRVHKVIKAPKNIKTEQATHPME